MRAIKTPRLSAPVTLRLRFEFRIRRVDQGSQLGNSRYVNGQQFQSNASVFKPLQYVFAPTSVFVQKAQTAIGMISWQVIYAFDERRV